MSTRWKYDKCHISTYHVFNHMFNHTVGSIVTEMKFEAISLEGVGLILNNHAYFYLGPMMEILGYDTWFPCNSYDSDLTLIAMNWILFAFLGLWARSRPFLGPIVKQAGLACVYPKALPSPVNFVQITTYILQIPFTQFYVVDYFEAFYPIVKFDFCSGAFNPSCNVRCTNWK